MMPFRRFALPVLALSTLALGVVGCDEETTVKADGTIRADGYALFAVENDQAQRNDVTVTVRDADPGATYVLLYSEKPPTDVGWFLFDPSTKSRCGGDLGAHCEAAKAGYMVDFVKVPEGATEVTLRDTRCGCDDDHDRDDDRDRWTGHWAVMRIERTSRTNKVTFNVRAEEVEGFVTDPEIRQLQ